MNIQGATRLWRALFVVGGIAAILAIVLALTGGFVLHIDGVRVSARSPRNAALIALITTAAAWALSTADQRRNAYLQLARSIRERWPRSLDLAAVIAIVASGLEISRWASTRPLWLDEEMIALNIRDRSVAGLAGALWLGQSAPFGWMVVERAMLITFGTGERALRAVPLLFGLATLATAVWMGRRSMSPIGAAILTVLCALGQWLAFYSLELKQYSADAFWALLVPGLTAWALEAPPGGSTVQMRRIAIWWGVAAVGHWFGNGALLVTPACAFILLAVTYRRAGWQAAGRVILLGLMWLASFAPHYVLALRHAVTSAYLKDYWAFALPPEAAGSRRTLAWLGSQLQPFASKPGGTRLWVAFWLSSACGFALSSSRPLGAALAAVPLSAFVLAALRVVPLYERISLWVVPALYAGVALFADGAVRFGRTAYARRNWLYLALALAITVVAVEVGSDIAARGSEQFRLISSSHDNHLLNDRAGVRWLIDQQQPGDVLVTTQLALPAVWWYGAVPISTPALGSRMPDGPPILVAGYVHPGPACRQNQLRDALEGRRRALVYLGFRFDDVPEGFDRLLLGSLGELGSMTAIARFGDAGRAAVFDLRSTSPPLRTDGDAGPGGCLSVRAASRW